MTQESALTSSNVEDRGQSLVSFTARLTGEQLGALRRCAKGISLRFEAWVIVDALVAGGFAEKGIGGVVTVTAKGEEYLRKHAA